METSAPEAASRRKLPQQARSVVTVDAIFDATVQVLLAIGSTRLNTTRVAQRAGVSVDTIYQSFPNKQALLLAVLERHVAMLADAVEAICTDHRGGAVPMMAGGVARAYLRAKARQVEASRALYLIATELNGSAMVEAATRRAERAIEALLLTASDRRFSSPPLAATVLLAILSARRGSSTNGASRLPPATTSKGSSSVHAAHMQRLRARRPRLSHPFKLTRGKSVWVTSPWYWCKIKRLAIGGTKLNRRQDLDPADGLGGKKWSHRAANADYRAD